MFHGRTVLSAIVIAGASVLLTTPLLAETMPAQTTQSASQTGKLRGLWLTTGFPSRSAEMGSPITIDLDLHNKALPPERVQLSIEGVPDHWKAEFVGGGSNVSAAMVNTDESKGFSLKLTPPKDAKAGSYDIKVIGKTADQTLTLPISLKLTAPEAAKLTLDPKLPDLRGTAKTSFDFEADLKNDSLKDTVVNLAAEAPPGFQVTFTQGYDSQEIASLPVKAGASKTIKAKVTPPDNAPAGAYKVLLEAQSPVANASAPVQLQITGQPKISLVGPNGRLSGSATAGKERDFTFTVVNSGSKAATGVKVSANPPSGWKVETEPKEIPAIAPNGKQEVSVHITPSGKAVAGDYMLAITANGKGTSDDAQFRVTVETSTIWGATGLGVIAAAIIVMAFGVRKYGRR
ncbi:MAG TPA: NEW3 domain-containing protein [Pararhizobium sp.]|nr:NEW3 domain-containing protein [Pararhizobium sp.]